MLSFPEIHMPRRMKFFLCLVVITFAFFAGYAQINSATTLRSPDTPHPWPVRMTKIEKTDFALYDEIKQLKAKVKDLEAGRKTYPEVGFLTYKDRKRILITGGAGFVGSHLADKLMMQGHEVSVVDNFFTGRKRNVEHWIGHPNFELIHHDIVKPLFIEVDQIYHLASPASPPNYMYNPIKTIKTNTIGTINMLGLAKRVRARLLLASTSEVYGDPEVHPQTEDYWGHVNPIGPRACYDEGKRVAETMCFAYKKQEQVEVRVARIFNTFGPRMHMNDGRVVSNFILQALQNQPITIYGEGKQTRSFQYVTDLVDGLVALMNSNYSLPVNIGNPDEHHIEEFATTIKALVKSQSEIVHKPAMQDDPQKRKPDISRAKKYLNWQPKVNMMDGINKTVEYFREELERSSHQGRHLPLPDGTPPEAVRYLIEH
ncbi:UDP-glucuronic acid decarboxylase 1 [Lingula anatina]|uniref:UDP-glucuronic acid decarboxylase 1 n=1 Tax=Lingula anatina TaxID=7574 RepID=A0A1S3KAS2_LINAN|nr:UDP-glucuronic acid decarboxylase 1 [Lingula anatina]|eukprot:XP_013419356.1 UDP-glucuronic acid decarboxylase 1 [Lingula anatina]